MKKQHIHRILPAAIALIASAAFAADAPAHDHAKKSAGPNGGRVVTAVEPHYELFVTPERRIRITFLGDDGKAAEPKAQTVSGTCGERTNPTRLTFAREGGSFLSDKPLPDGNLVPLVLQVKSAPDAKPVTERLNVNLEDCPGCKHQEYACTCESHADH